MVHRGEGWVVLFSACRTAASGKPDEHRIFTRHRRPLICTAPPSPAASRPLLLPAPPLPTLLLAPLLVLVPRAPLAPSHASRPHCCFTFTYQGDLPVGLPRSSSCHSFFSLFSTTSPPVSYTHLRAHET